MQKKAEKRYKSQYLMKLFSNLKQKFNMNITAVEKGIVLKVYQKNRKFIFVVIFSIRIRKNLKYKIYQNFG